MDRRIQYNNGENLMCNDNDEKNNLWMDEISGLFDWDESDPDITGGSNPKPHEQPASKNVHTERKRRKKLNDTLYKLRAVVPKISKMDKQSIIGDAISHVLDLQKKIREIEGEIEVLCSSNKVHDHTQITPEMIKPVTKAHYSLQKRSAESSHAKKSVHTLENGEVLERKLMEIRKIGEDGLYHVQIESKKDARVLVDLTRALECLPVEIMNSNMSCFDQAIHYTLFVRSLENVAACKLEDMIRQTINTDFSR